MASEKTRAELNYEARVDIATAYRACNYYDLDYGIFNHITQRAPARDREGDVMLVVPHGLLWNEVTASCMIGVDFETGKVVEGEGEIAKTANAIHRAIHKIRYPIDGTVSIMHTHQPYTTCLACVDDPEPFKFRLTQGSMFMYGKMEFDYNYTGVAHADEEGYRLAKVLGDKSILMMGNHGVLTVGKSARNAFTLLYTLEKASKIQVLAQSTGMKLLQAPEKVAKEVASCPFGDDVNLFFNALKRQMTQPCVTA
ncbi:putative aldolase class 2 protein PA3430 isoform X1 [Lytechinus pictus]|uniref:putative aldolase class 2 protein PA3430 isoform X1 n=1 Tax=Lytechinus pictus TaxID=7653 RepID=UPI0030B9BC75